MGDLSCSGSESAINNCNFTVLDSHDRTACVGGGPLMVRCSTGYKYSTKMRRFPPNHDPERPVGTVPNVYQVSWRRAVAVVSLSTVNISSLLKNLH